MGKIYSHIGISKEKLGRKNSIILDNRKEVFYKISYSQKLIVNMEFIGQENNGKSNVNSCGWKRDSRYYFRQLLNNHPELFSEENKWLIEDGLSPLCDKVFIDFFPEYKHFLGDKLIHHHIGEDGQSVALPEGLHTGYGIVHNVEKELGITKNGHDFSNAVQINHNGNKKFDWEQDADEIIKKDSTNNVHNKQKDVREKSSEPRYRKKQFVNPNKFKVEVVKVVKVVRVIRKGLWSISKIAIPIVAPVIVKKLMGRNGEEDDIEYNEEYTSDDSFGNGTHASPKEHNVKGHGQHYNTRDGRIWKEKESFSRGNKDNDV